MFIPPHPFNAIASWPVRSQQQARRNAMIASTSLAQRRAELVEVEEFLASLAPDATQEPGARAARG